MISNDARVSGKNQLLSLAPVVLSSGMKQETGRKNASVQDRRKKWRAALANLWFNEREKKCHM